MTLRTRVRSVMTSPRAPRSSGIFLRRRQYSVMERSPWTKLRNCLKLDGGLSVAKELGLDGEPGVPGGGTLGGDDFGEVVGECAENPRLHHAVHPCLVRREDRGVEVDVILKGELAEGQQKLTAPSIEVIGVDV